MPGLKKGFVYEMRSGKKKTHTHKKNEKMDLLKVQEMEMVARVKLILARDLPPQMILARDPDHPCGRLATFE